MTITYGAASVANNWGHPCADCHAIVPLASSAPAQPALLAVLAHGRGPQQVGAQTGQVTVDTIAATLEEAASPEPQNLLEQAFTEAARQIEALKEEWPLWIECTALLINQNRLHAAFFGSHYLFLLRGELLQQITRRHNLIQYLAV